jgi:hypothetical protein
MNQGKFRKHAFETGILFCQLLHLFQFFHLQARVALPPPVKGGGADTYLPAEFLGTEASFMLLKRFDNLISVKTGLFHSI